MNANPKFLGQVFCGAVITALSISAVAVEPCISAYDSHLQYPTHPKDKTRVGKAVDLALNVGPSLIGQNVIYDSYAQYRTGKKDAAASGLLHAGSEWSSRGDAARLAFQSMKMRTADNSNEVLAEEPPSVVTGLIEAATERQILRISDPIYVNPLFDFSNLVIDQEIATLQHTHPGLTLNQNDIYAIEQLIEQSLKDGNEQGIFCRGGNLWDSKKIARLIHLRLDDKPFQAALEHDHSADSADATAVAPRTEGSQAHIAPTSARAAK